MLKKFGFRILVTILAIFSLCIGFVVTSSSISSSSGIYISPDYLKISNEDRYDLVNIENTTIDSTGGNTGENNGPTKLLQIASNEVDSYNNDKALMGGTKYWDWWDTKTGKTINRPCGWGCLFVYYCADQAGLIGDGAQYSFGKEPYIGCSDSLNSMKQLGYSVYNYGDYTPVPGDIIYFSNDDYKTITHIGIVESVNSQGHIITLEGNTGPVRDKSISDGSSSISNRKDRTQYPYFTDSKLGIYGYCHIEYKSTAYTDPNFESFAFKYRNLSNEERRKALFGDANKTYFASAQEAAPYIVGVDINTWDIDSNGNKYTRTWTLYVNKMVADEVKAIMDTIYNDPEKFPIHNIGGARYSDNMRHSWGCAIDINWEENYYVNYKTGQQVGNFCWKNGSSPYCITPDNSVVKAFAKYGWGWGGQGWSTAIDVMHFSILSTGG